MKTFRALTTTVGVSVDPDVVLAEVVEPLVRSYPPADNADLHYELRATELLRNGARLRCDDPRDVVPLFEMDLYEQVVARAEPGWLLHAAALDVGGRALVLCGQSGAGKTTLTLALGELGHRALTEEVVWIDRLGTVRGLPRPLHLVSGDRNYPRIPTHWSRVRYPLRDRTGTVRDHLLAVPPPEAFELGPLPLHAIVQMSHGPNRDRFLRANPAHATLQGLWEQSLRQDDAGIVAATAVVRTHPCYELSSTSESEAVALLAPLLK